MPLAKNDDGLLFREDSVVGYVIDFGEHGVRDPEGKVDSLTPEEIDRHNAALAAIKHEHLLKTGRGILYLDVPNSRVTDFLGIRKYTCRMRRGRHNLAEVRYDVWFYLDGSRWHGVTYGNDTMICHVKRTKRPAS